MNMDGLSKNDKLLSKKEKAALKKLEKEKAKKEKEKLKQEKALQKQREKEAKKLGVKSPGGSSLTTPPTPFNKTPSAGDVTNRAPAPLKKAGSGVGLSAGMNAAVEAVNGGKDGADPSLPGLLGAKVKRRRPRKFKEKEFNQILESIRTGAFTGTVLDLSNKYLDKYAAADLAKVLASNSTITELNISENEIGDDGVVPLSRMLEKNKTIRILDVQFNMLTRKGTKHLLTCLNNNVFITELYMDEREVNLGEMFVNTDTALEAIGADVRDRIDKLIQSNKNFQLLLEGKSNSLELPDRSQSYVNTHILERFPDLGNIDLRKNKLKFIPEEIGLLKKLEQLLLSDNKIEKLPNQIGELPNLRILDLANNNLSELPLALTTLPRLKHLNLQNNKFNDLPRFSLGSMKSLVTLDIRGNPLAQMSCMGSSFMDVVQQGGRETLSFLRENNKGMAEVWRMKIMFVGNGNVGKTTLLSHFIKQKSRLPAGGHASTAAAMKDTSTSRAPGSQIRTPKVPKTLENVATDGIDIHMWNHKHPGKSWVNKPGAESLNDDDFKEKYINFSCWDFAGQEVYYATHSFFLSQRALYILVFNLLEPEETNQIEYWLQSINSRTENSPIIMVGTHSEDKRCTQEYIQLYFGKIMEKYGQRFRNHIVSMHAISNIEKNSGIPELKEKIVRVSLAQDCMPDRIALSFLALEEKLMGAQQTLNPPTLSFSDYSQMALDCNISENNILMATKFLNDLGSLVYFSDKDEGLNDLVIVDPQWITKTFATVVSLKFGFIRDGLMKVSDLPHIWAAPNYPPALHPKLIAMLEKLEIISRLKHDGEDKILIPCLLPENPPAATVMDEVWPVFDDTSPQAGRFYSFEFVPLGFFSRLIVRFLVSHYEPILYWKKGIILKKDTEKIKLTINKDSKNKGLPMTMELWVRGPSPGRHLLDLVDNIDTLVDDWLRVKFERAVPCVHCIKEGSQDPYLFPLRVVEQSFADNYKTVRCRGITEVPISTIAPDVAMAEFEDAVVRLSDIQKGKMIGEGGFAKVYKAIWDNKVIALKELTLDSSSTTEAIGFEFEDATDPLAVFAEFRKEVSLMRNMKHPNIVNLLGLCVDPFCMLLEFCGLGCLYDYIHNEEKALNWPIAIKLATDIAKGMNFMHTYTPPLIHRDLKSPNILLAIEPDETGTPMIIAKVADFGLSRKLMLAGQLKLKVVDNPVWLAPEMMRKESYDEKVDVYSYGVILWELIARKDFLGHITFLSAIEDAVLKGERPVIPEACLEQFPEYAQLVNRCWADKPKDRPDFGHCLKVLETCKKDRLPRVPDRMPEWKMEVVAPETIKAEKDTAKAPVTQPAENERTTTSVPITKHRQPQRKVVDDNEPRASPEVLAIVHGGDRTTKTLLPFARGRGSPLPKPSPRSQPRPYASTEPSKPHPDTRDRSGSWQRGVKSNVRVVDGNDVQVSSFERTLEPNLGSAITCMAAWNDCVWSATASGRTVVWDTKTGKMLKEIAMHSQGITAMLLVQQREMWTASTDGTLKLWSYEGEEIAELPIKAVGYSMLEDPTTHFVWIGCNVQNAAKKQPPEFGAIQVWDPATRKQKKSWRVEPFVIAGSGDVNAVSPIPYCMLYHMNHVFVGAGPRILCYEPQTFAAQGYMEDHTGELTVMISIGDEIWSAGRDKLVKVWNPKEHGSDCIATMEGHVGEVMGLCADASGHVWSCGWDKKIFVWDAGDVKRFLSFLPTQHTKSISSVLLTTYTEAGKTVKKMWSGSLDGAICLWRLETFVKVY